MGKRLWLVDHDMSMMQITESMVERVPVVAISGVIDRETCVALRRFLLRKLTRKTRGLVLDLSGVLAVDACGMATLIEYRRRALGFDGELVLVGLCPRVQAAFELMRLEGILPLRDDVAAGVEAMGWMCASTSEVRAWGFGRIVWPLAIVQRMTGRWGVLRGI